MFLILVEVRSDVPKAEIARLDGEKLRRENRDEESLAKFQEALGLDMKLAKVSFLRFRILEDFSFEKIAAGTLGNRTAFAQVWTC